MSRQIDSIHPNPLEYEGWEEHYAQVNGVKLYYECENCTANSDKNLELKTPVLIVHGWTANRFRLHPLYIHLRDQGAPVFRVELRGHAWSQKKEISDFSLPAMAEDIHQFILEIMIKMYKFQKVVIIAHSMGGIICQGVALKQPTYLKKLVLLSTSPCWFDNFLRRFITKMTIKKWKVDPVGMFDKKKKGHIALGLENFPVWFDKYKIDGRDLFPVKEAAIQTLVSMLKTDFRKEIHKIEVPTLIIVGAKDFLATPRFSKFMNKQIPNSELHIITDCGHNIDQDRPLDYHPLIDKFLE
jgi:pimeloyl-ACP methyl ester carboxylesterase